MRLRIFGIPRSALFGAGFFPAAVWCAFHPMSVMFLREDLFWVCGIGFVSGVGLSWSVRRGFFFARFFLYLAFISGLLAAMVNSVLDRDFVLLGIAVVAFFSFSGIVLWLERRIEAAALNPGHRWYEGALKVLPGIEARVLADGLSHRAQVRAFDPRGVFVFFDQPFSFKPHQKVELELGDASARIKGDARILAHFGGEKMGLGLQFLAKDLYHLRDYTSLIEQWRGRGIKRDWI